MKQHPIDLMTQKWVKWTGKRVDPSNSAWLIGPVGDPDLIGDKFMNDLAVEEKLTIHKNLHGSGLMDDFNELELSPEEMTRISPEVVDFYEHTSDYDFEIWSEWKGIFRPFGWLLAIIFSRRLQQLNLPLSSMDSAKGIQSNIIKLYDPNTATNKWTIWYRILRSTGNVIYSGVYTTTALPNKNDHCLKVIFPLPNGNATVIMRVDVLDKGELLLSSDGRKFGDNGFYFTLTDHNGKYWARFVRSMHEWIKVYVDDDQVLRADHHLKFCGFPFLELHYKMQKKKR
jgi:hypothetical protein